MTRRLFARRVIRAGAAGLLLLLGACAVPPRLVGHGAAAFSRSGRFAVNVSDNSGEPRAVQGGFSWLDEGGNQRLDLANPLGSTLARVDITPAGAVLLRADGTREFAQNADALVAQVVGGPIPVEGLRTWLRGRTDGRARDLKTGAGGKIESFLENGWSVRLTNYDALGPRLLVLRRADAGTRIVVRLVIDS
ncbi:MAG: outer membrane lipoprotein LolB [Candidimonas sp.]|nr:MAG: outer membrane lipoprotein LolB [Candidimonas sp.]